MNILRQIVFVFLGATCGLTGLVLTCSTYLLDRYDLPIVMLISREMIITFLPVAVFIVFIGAICFKEKQFVKHLGSGRLLFLNAMLVLLIVAVGFFARVVRQAVIESLQAIVCYRLALSIYFTLNLRRPLRLLSK